MPAAKQEGFCEEMQPQALPTRSVRRDSGYVQTALSEKCGPPGVVLGAKTRFAPELVPVGSSALRQVTGFRTGRGARALSRHIGSSTAGLGSGPCTCAGWTFRVNLPPPLPIWRVDLRTSIQPN